MNTIVPFLTTHGYTLLFVWVFAETLGLPVPSAPLLIAVGALAGAGQMSLFSGIGIVMAAALLGDLFWYAMGKRHGARALAMICRITLEPDSCVRRMEDVFARYGARSFLVTKFVPGLSAVATPLAGMTGMRLWRFLPLDGMGTLLWAAAYGFAGYLFSGEIDRAIFYALGTGRTLTILVSSALSLYILRKVLLRRRFLRELSIARITPAGLKRKIDAGEEIVIIDVRHPLDFAADPAIIPGARRIPLEEFKVVPDIPKGREIVVYCT